MNTYELMLKTNHQLIKGKTLTVDQKNKIVDELLNAASTDNKVLNFKIGVKAPEYSKSLGNTSDTRVMYPLFYIPPYNNGKKLKTILNQTPKTQIFSANMYELEILRLLYLFAPKNEKVSYMVKETLSRLKTTCFGFKDDGLGECFDTSLVVLRFISTVCPEDRSWILSRIDNYNNYVNEKKRPWFSLWYFWLCLSEMPFDIAKPEIDKYKSEILNWLCNKSCVMNSEHDKTIHPVIICVLRNVISNYPEYKYIKNREPYINEKDGRLYFNMEE